MGYITIDRRIFGHYFWTENRPYSKFEAWLDLIQLVSYKNDNKQLVSGQLVRWERGQFPISRSFLASRWVWSENKVRTYLKLLEDDQMITMTVVGKITILTLCNYDTYNAQSPDERPDERPDQRPGERPDESRMKDQMKAGSQTRIKEGKEDKESKEGEEEDLSQFENAFEIFRQNYPGTKKGFEVEFENFKKKTKDWKDIVLILSDKLQGQIYARDENALRGGFVPVWKNLQTWINQKCWTEEISITNESNGNNKPNSCKGASAQELAELMAKKLAAPAEV